MQPLTYDDVAVPRVGIGTWELEGDTAYGSVRAALDAGYRHVDTAAMYGNEEQVGRAIADSGVDRDELFVTTKVWRDDAAPADVERATAECLERLGLDHVDLLLIHWPSDAAPLEATAQALDAQREAGRTRLIGVSNHTAAQFRRVAAVAPVATNQVEYHARLDQTAVLDAVRESGAFLTAYSPLAHGSLFGDEQVETVAADAGTTVPGVALAWLLDQDDVAVLPRSSDPDHVAENLEAARSTTLGDEQRAALDALPKDRREVDPPFAPDWDAPAAA